MRTIVAGQRRGCPGAGARKRRPPCWLRTHRSRRGPPWRLTDGQIEALARQGRVFGVSPVNAFMSAERADVATVADHVDHAGRLVVADHVAYGSDSDGTDTLPLGLEDVTRLPSLTAELLARGCDEPSLRRILGENYLSTALAPAPSSCSRGS